MNRWARAPRRASRPRNRAAGAVILAERRCPKVWPAVPEVNRVPPSLRACPLCGACMKTVSHSLCEILSGGNFLDTHRLGDEVFELIRCSFGCQKQSRDQVANPLVGKKGRRLRPEDPMDALKGRFVLRADSRT